MIAGATMEVGLYGPVFVVIFNATLLYVFYKTFKAVSLREMLAEKADGIAAGQLGDTSSSRVIGFIGGMTMTCFVWAIANVVIFLGLTNSDAVEKFITSIGGFLVSGAALFLPYAVNKLSDVGKSMVQDGGADKDKAAKDEAAKKAEADKKDEAAKKVDADKKKAADTSTKQIDDALAAGPATADKMKAIVAEAIKTATGG